MCYRYSSRPTAPGPSAAMVVIGGAYLRGGSHMHVRTRREFITLLGGGPVAWASVTGAGHAQTDFPNRHIHMIVPYPAGGIADIATRIVTDKLSEIWHQPIVVEAKPGASGNLAWDQVSRAEPELLCKVRILKLHFDRPRAAQS